MNRYFLIATLFMPAITHGMDKLTQKMSGLKLPISSKSPAKSAALPVPPAIPVDNNNATLQSKPELKHLVALLQNPNDSVEQLQKTDALFKSEFAQLEHSLYGPVLYDLAQHAQILRAKIEEKEKIGRAHV